MKELSCCVALRTPKASLGWCGCGGGRGLFLAVGFWHFFWLVVSAVWIPNIPIARGFDFALLTQPRPGSLLHYPLYCVEDPIQPLLIRNLQQHIRISQITPNPPKPIHIIPRDLGLPFLNHNHCPRKPAFYDKKDSKSSLRILCEPFLNLHSFS